MGAECTGRAPPIRAAGTTDPMVSVMVRHAMVFLLLHRREVLRRADALRTVLDVVEVGSKTVLANRPLVPNTAVFYFEYQDVRVSTFTATIPTVTGPTMPSSVRSSTPATRR
jgi:hypothetical protein